MLLSLLLFVLSLFLLFLSSKALTRNFFEFFYRLTKSQSAATNLLFFLLLPGIFLHEFSHILAAELLRVPTGHLSLKPEFKNNQIKFGSAQIASTDPIRLTLIGVAPFISGSLILWLLLKFGFQINFQHLSFLTLNQISSLPFYTLLLTSYCLFAVTNTMFSSPSDLQTAALPLILILLILGVLQLTPVNLPQAFIIYTTHLFYLLSITFGLTLILNFLLLLILKLSNLRS